MEEYDLKDSFTIESGESITIAIDEDFMSIKAFTETGECIGSIELTEIEESSGDYYITRMYLDELSNEYTHKGIGRKCLLFFKEVYVCNLYAADNDGQRRSDGSHLTEDAPYFIAKMRAEGVVVDQR